MWNNTPTMNLFNHQSPTRIVPRCWTSIYHQHTMSLTIREDTCANTNEYDGRDGLRILSVFMILIASTIGAFFPLVSKRSTFIKMPSWCWFIAKFFGSGVIIATGFVHLLQPAAEGLSDPCLTGPITEYPWAFGMCLMSLFLTFFMELVSSHYVRKATRAERGDIELKENCCDDDDEECCDPEEVCCTSEAEECPCEEAGSSDEKKDMDVSSLAISRGDEESHSAGTSNTDNQKYMDQILSVFFLEFGIVFHSVFIGLSLAVAGDEFITLFIVLCFHQMFEGFGLGTRIADTPWDSSRKYTPWLLALGYALTTPIAIAIGLGVRHSFNPNSKTALIANGVFDSVCAGVLIYTGVVELMAHEFLYSDTFDGEGGFKKMMLAFGTMCGGAGLMALLGKWA